MTGLLKVELIDGTVCRMAPRALELFLARGEVAKFERSGEWAIVGRDPMRSTRRTQSSPACCTFQRKGLQT